MLQAVRLLTEFARPGDHRRDSEETMEPGQSTSSEASVQFREIYKNGWLRRTDKTDKETSRFWVAFCVHDDVEPRLEGFTDQKQATTHSPIWANSLRGIQHLSPTLCATSRHDYEFCVNFNDDRVLRLAAPTYQGMLDWVQLVTRKLTDMKILRPKENLYSRGPERIATRDPTSPLPPPPLPSGTSVSPPIPPTESPSSSAPSTSSPIRGESPQATPMIFTFEDLSIEERRRPVQAQSQRTTPPTPSPRIVATISSDPGESSYESIFMASSHTSPEEPSRILPRDAAVSSQSESSNEQRYAVLMEYRSSSGTLEISRPPEVPRSSEIPRSSEAPRPPAEISREIPRSNENSRPPETSRSTEISSRPPEILRSSENSRFPETSRSSENSRPPEILRSSENSRFPETSRSSENSRPSEILRSSENSRFPEVSRSSENSRLPDTSRSLESSRFPETSRSSENSRLPDTSRSLENSRFPETSRSSENSRFPEISRSSENSRFPEISRSSENSRPPETSRSFENSRLPETSRSFENSRFPETSRSSEVSSRPPEIPRSSETSRPPDVSRPPVINSSRSATEHRPGTSNLGRVLTLREQQVCQLKLEMNHRAGVRLKLGRRDCKDGIAFVDTFGSIWVAGWKQREHPQLYNVLHVGDRVLSVAGVVPATAAAIRDIVKGVTTPRVEVIVRRLPHAQAIILKKRTDEEEFGLEVNGNEVSGVTGVASSAGLPQLAEATNPTAPTGSNTTWTLTEVNGRPLSIFDGGATERLRAVGRDISIVIQPTDLISSFRKKLRAIRSYKNFVLQ